MTVDRILKAAVIAAAVMGSLASPAFACRFRAIQQETLSDYPVVLIATIRSAERVHSTGFNVFNLEAEVQHTAEGAPASGRYVFTSTQSSIGCGVALSPVGEVWALYLNSPDASDVGDAWPISQARAVDSRIVFDEPIAVERP